MDNAARNDRAAPTADAASGDAFDAWLDDFFAHYYARRPVNATFIGVHDHDHVLPDFTAEATAHTVAEMRALRERLASIPIEGLTEAQRHDHLLADGYLDLQLWEDEAPQFHRGNPSLYTGEAIFAVLSLFLRDSEPLSERTAAATSRMRALPAFLDQGRTNVREAPTAWTERAIREVDAASAYFARGVPILAAERGIDDPAFLTAAGEAHDAFANHAAWLREELLSHPSEQYASGRDAFDRYLARGHCLPPGRDAQWVEAYAWQAFERAREELDQAARELDPTRSASDQLASLADLHPTVDEYGAAYGRVWDAARTAATEHDLVSWPDYPIDYVPIPAADREAAAGLYYLPYRCPPPFGRSEVHRYLVRPILPDMTPAEQESVLRVANDSAIKLNHVVHHGGLGHHVQNWHAFRAASRIGQIGGVDGASRIAVFGSGTLVEGWACYATDLMDEIGFLTPLESLAERQGRVRMAARAIVDVGLHTGVYTLDQATAFYTDEVGMPEAAARDEAVKNSLFPGAAMMYLIGTDAIHDLRQELTARDGAAFSLRSFHDRVLNFGAIPVSLIGASMLDAAVSGSG